jgi:hypothetical protein
MTVIPGALDSDTTLTTRTGPRRTEEIVEAWSNPQTGLQFAQPVDHAALRATASAFAQLEAMTAYLEDVDPRSNRMRGPLNHSGVPRPVMRIYFTAYREVMAGLRALGATPAARAEMMSGVAAGVGVASQLAAHRKAREHE